MASRDTFLQRHSNKVELLSFVPKKEQKDFSQYLYSNYQVWNKERRRCFYRCRKFKKNSIPIINNAPSHSAGKKFQEKGAKRIQGISTLFSLLFVYRSFFLLLNLYKV